MRVNYAILFVSDMKRSVLFYRDVLGLPLKFESPGGQSSQPMGRPWRYTQRWCRYLIRISRGRLPDGAVPV